MHIHKGWSKSDQTVERISTDCIKSYCLCTTRAEKCPREVWNTIWRHFTATSNRPIWQATSTEQRYANTYICLFFQYFHVLLQALLGRCICAIYDMPQYCPTSFHWTSSIWHHMKNNKEHIGFNQNSYRFSKFIYFSLTYINSWISRSSKYDSDYIWPCIVRSTL